MIDSNEIFAETFGFSGEAMTINRPYETHRDFWSHVLSDGTPYNR